MTIGFLLCLIMHIFHFPVNRISFTKYLFFSFKSGRQIKIPLSITTLRIRQKPIYLLGTCRSDSLLGHLFTRCLSHGANQPAAGRTCLALQTHSAISTSLTSNRSSYRNLKLPLQSTGVRPYSTAPVAPVQKNDTPQAHVQTGHL